MKNLLKMLKEPSTWAGVGVVMASATPAMPGAWGVLTQIGAALAGGMAMALKEKGAPVDLVEAK